MSDRELVFLNAVNLIAEPSGKIRALKTQLGSFERVFAFLSSETGSSLDPDRAYRELARRGIALVPEDDVRYPALLRGAHLPPLGLYVWGSIDCGGMPFGIVGTRKASVAGREAARKISATLAASGFTIVSGLMYGIDREAHRGALLGGGKTVGVVGFGLDQVFEDALAKEIVASGGGVCSEYPLGAPGLKYHFPARDRIIAGMAKGVLVVEAPERSGALITARFALENNRDVFAIPGNPENLLRRGCNRLIQDGAKLTLDASDICEEYDVLSKTDIGNDPGALRESPVYQLLAKGTPQTSEEICRALGGELQRILAVLGELELLGLIRRSGERYTV